jgi:hypothetical protein
MRQCLWRGTHPHVIILTYFWMRVTHTDLHWKKKAITPFPGWIPFSNLPTNPTTRGQKCLSQWEAQGGCPRETATSACPQELVFMFVQELFEQVARHVETINFKLKKNVLSEFLWDAYLQRRRNRIERRGYLHKIRKPDSWSLTNRYDK